MRKLPRPTKHIHMLEVSAAQQRCKISEMRRPTCCSTAVSQRTPTETPSKALMHIFLGDARAKCDACETERLKSDTAGREQHNGTTTDLSELATIEF